MERHKEFRSAICTREAPKMRGGVGSDGSNTEEPILAKEHGSGLGSAYCHAGPPQGEEVNMECN